MPRLQAGDRINNYLLDERLGTGSFGDVWKAHHHIFQDPVAIKFPTDAQYVRHLQREGAAIHGLRDTHIVRPLDIDPYADPPYLVMEYVNGPALRELIRQHPQGMPIDPSVAVLYGLLLALEVAHREGLVHRDVKPENILIEGGRGLATITPSAVKVTDFGLGFRSDALRQSIMQSGSLDGEAHHHLSGTIAYMSPEQRDGLPDEQIDARSDLYSAGVVLHEMLTGMLPQGSDLPSSIRSEVPRWLDRLFEKCYTRRERRFASAGEMLAGIERYWTPPWPRAGAEASPGMKRVSGRWYCAACEGQVSGEDQFCIYCGHQLVRQVPRCPTCHGFVGRGDHYCILCGADLRQAV